MKIFQAYSSGGINGHKHIHGGFQADRAQLILDAKPVYRDFAELCPQITRDDIRRAVQQGACAIYHASSHNNPSVSEMP